MSKVRGISSERIAKRLLESRGFHVVATHSPVLEGEEKVAAVDIIAEDAHGERYAVEVKAGRGDVDAIRQTYANAKLCGCQPMLICKGCSKAPRHRR
jgi:predicted RecB family endonuclease